MKISGSGHHFSEHGIALSPAKRLFSLLKTGGAWHSAYYRPIAIVNEAFWFFFVHVVKLLEHQPQKFQGKIPIFMWVRLLQKWKIGDSLKSPGLDAVFHSKLKFPTGWVHGHYYQPPIILIGTLWKILEMFSGSMTRVSEGLEWVGIFFPEPGLVECENASFLAANCGNTNTVVTTSYH